MDWSYLWKAVLIVIAGTLLLRIAGRKSISQMTLAQTVIMIGIGTLLIQPVSGHNLWETLLIGALLVMTLILMEYAQLKSDLIERFISGRSKVLIQNGVVDEKMLRKLRLTVDQLEIQLRQKSIANVSDVQFATLEPSGQIGYILTPSARPANGADIDRLTAEIYELRKLINQRLPYVKLISQSGHWRTTRTPKLKKLRPAFTNEQPGNLFTEVLNNEHSSPPPQHLQ